MIGFKEIDTLFDNIIAQLKDPSCPPVVNPFTAPEMSGEEIHFRRYVPAEVIETSIKIEDEAIGELMRLVNESRPPERDPLDESEAKKEPAEDAVSIQFERPEAPGQNDAETSAKRVYYTITVTVSEDKLYANISVSGGGSYTVEELMEALERSGIKYGIDEAALKKMSDDRIFGENVAAAKGKPVKHGVNGTIENVAAPDTDIKKGDEICRLIPAEMGEDGIDVFGGVIPAKKGKAPKVPQGNNTGLNETHTALVAITDGHLVFDGEVFAVKDEILISGDLKRPNDHINASGDVTINGNVNEGAVIMAAGNVYVRGSVTGANIIAKKIVIDFAVRHTILQSQGAIKLANCYDSEITSEGSIQATTLSDCSIICAGEITCIGGQGIISGGTIRSIGKVTCQVMGSNMNEPIKVYLGDSSRFQSEKQELLEKIRVIDNDINKLDLHVNAIKKRKESGGKLPKEDLDFINASMRIKLQKSLTKEPLLTRLKYVEAILAHTEDTMLVITHTLFPNVTITIRDHTATTDIRHGKVTVYESDTGLVYAGS